jgi:hypothetical protein
VLLVGTQNLCAVSGYTKFVCCYWVHKICVLFVGTQTLCAVIGYTKFVGVALVH